MTSEEARIGPRVRVREEHRTPHVRGKTGTVTHTWGDPRYLVLDVLLDVLLDDGDELAPRVGGDRRDALATGPRRTPVHSRMHGPHRRNLGRCAA